MVKPDRKVVYSTDEAGDESPFAVLRGQMGPDGEDASPENSKPAASPAKRAPKAPPAALRVQRERKGRRGKTVSIIVGVPGPEARRQDLLKQLKQKLGTGGALEGDTIVIQGDQRDRVVEILNQMGYRAKSAGG